MYISFYKTLVISAAAKRVTQNIEARHPGPGNVCSAWVRIILKWAMLCG